ncbi:MAG: cell wall hydrolase [Ruminococcaceae bacterium]|nr:cell wall hydrolase [Oscillospiraceae bacterium]
MKKHGSFFAFLALFVCCGLIASALFYHAEGLFGAMLTNAAEKDAPVIILDAGHGGEDGGATGTNGVPEKDLNLSLSRTLAALLRGAGYTVVQTRTEDKLLYPAGTKKGHKKQGDLTARLAYTEKYPNSIFVSIHMNTFPLPDCEGVQVWYSENHENSAVLAKAIQENVKALLQPSNHRRIKAATSSIYILKHAKTPAVLVECGFLSTPAECALLSDAAYRQKLALVLFDAICDNLRSATCESEENDV